MKKIDWHAGFVSAMKLELMEYGDDLIYSEEHHLANRAQRIDLLIIKNSKDILIANPIGSMFSKFNICEYKSPDDSLSYGDFYQVLAYTSLYLKETPKNYNHGADAYTMTLVREPHPHKLFKLLRNDGINISSSQPGIYILANNLPFKTQVIVTKELPEDPSSNYNTWLKSLTKKGTDNELNNILKNTTGLDEFHKKFADNVMDIFTKANNSIVKERLKEEKGMCNAVNELVREIYADEIKEMKDQLADKDSVIANKDSVIANKDSVIADKDSKLAQQASLIAQLQTQLAQYQTESSSTAQ